MIIYMFRNDFQHDKSGFITIPKSLKKHALKSCTVQLIHYTKIFHLAYLLRDNRNAVIHEM